MSHMLQPTILLLKEGTDTSQGKPQLISNISACCAIVDMVSTTLGPRGMDKLIYDTRGNVTISNDGATIMKLLDIVHPAAKTLVEIAKSQDSEVGDGTTSVVVLAGQLLKQSKEFVEDGMHPTIIIKGLREACRLAKDKIRELSFDVVNDNNNNNEDEKNISVTSRELLIKCAATALNSKLIGSHKEFFAPLVVDAVLHLDDDQDINLIGIKKEKGGSMEDSQLIHGVAFKKCFSYAGFEQQPKKIFNPKILVLNIELELKAEKDNAEVRVEGVDDYNKIVEAEWKIIFDKLESIVNSGANIILSKLAIGDLATQYFADRNIFCAGRCPDDDLIRVQKATGAKMQTSVNDLNAQILGTCGLFEERQVGGQRYNLFTECVESKTATIILRGGGEQFIAEMDRSINDAIMIVRRARKHNKIVPGGGAIEMEISKYLRKYSRTIHGKQQLIINAFAKALEVIPQQLSINAGLDSTTILNKLRQRHDQENGECFGVDLNNDDICDTFKSFVWEPAVIKLNSFEAATSAACSILSVDETIKNPAANNEMPNNLGQGSGMRMPF
eukprot:TRINITY_DN517_c1_g1_i1.p1 TRINITY_DN517_c1_g1~~TRINITY_DN517_c1_g1_i1.p1  ORF type:complete len:558 (-),score=228.73 TRINITY_DN517_c1_g1_i1:225-1898(-)